MRKISGAADLMKDTAVSFISWAKEAREFWVLYRRAKTLSARMEAADSLFKAAAEPFRSGPFIPQQRLKEAFELLKVLRGFKPGVLCEIGGADGGMLALLCHAAPSEARILSIDINYRLSQRLAYPALARPGQRVTCLKADSHCDRTLSQVKRWLSGTRLDFLLIDGDHSLSGVSQDYRMYSPMVRPGGWIGFHDIKPDFKSRYGLATGANSGEVHLFWADLKKSRPETLEIVEDPDQDGYGIGLARSFPATISP